MLEITFEDTSSVCDYYIHLCHAPIVIIKYYPRCIIQACCILIIISSFNIMQCSIVTMSQENVLSRTFLVILNELLELILNDNSNKYSTEISMFKFRIDAAKKLLSWNIYITSAISI